MSNNDNQRQQEVPQQTAAGQAAPTNKGPALLVNVSLRFMIMKVFLHTQVLCLHDDNCFDRRAELIRVVEERSGGIYHIHPTFPAFRYVKLGPYTPHLLT